MSNEIDLLGGQWVVFLEMKIKGTIWPGERRITAGIELPVSTKANQILQPKVQDGNILQLSR